MTDRITVLKLRTDGAAALIDVDNTADGLHFHVGGYFEVFYVKDETTDPMNSVIGLCDDDGWRDPKAVNPYSYLVYHTQIAGNIVLLRATPDGNFASLTRDDVVRLLLRFGLVTVADNGPWSSPWRLV